MKKNIFYVFRTARQNNIKKIKSGDEPDHILYGMNHLQQFGYKVSFTDRAYSRGNLLFWLFFPFQNFIISKTTIGFKLDQAILLLPDIMRCDLVVTTADSAGLPILLLKKIGIMKKPIVYISVGLINEIYFKKTFMTLYYRNILDQADAIICHSPQEKELFLKLNPRLKDKTWSIPFGIDYDFFKGKHDSKGYIFSVGRDRSRDFSFLAKVAKVLPKEQFIVVTSKTNVKGIPFPSNVTILYDLPYRKVKELYLAAKLIFLPLKELRRASGQISFLESIATGNNIVVTDVFGIRLVYPDLVFKDNVQLFKRGSILGAKNAILEINKEKNVFVLPNRYTSRQYAKSLSQIIEKIL